MFKDPIVAEVRRVRETIAAEYDNDIHKLFAHWREREGAHQDRVVKNARNTTQTAAADAASQK